MSTLEVSESEALFLDDALRRLGRLAQQIREIPPRGYLFDYAYGEQFAPLYAQVEALRDEGFAVLPENSESRAAFRDGVTGVLRALGRAQNAEEGALEALWAYMSNPLGFSWRVAKNTAASAVVGGKAIVRDATKGLWDTVADAFSSPWAWVAVAGVGALAFAGGRRR